MNALKDVSAHQYITAHPYWNRPYSTVLDDANCQHPYWNSLCSIPSGANVHHYWSRPYNTAVVAVHQTFTTLEQAVHQTLPEKKARGSERPCQVENACEVLNHADQCR